MQLIFPLLLPKKVEIFTLEKWNY